VRRSACLPPRPPFLDASSKSTDSERPERLPSTSVRSAPRLRAGPRTRTRHRPWALPPIARLPTRFRPLAPKRMGLDHAASACSSHAGARGHAPLVDFCQSSDPLALPSDHRYPTTKEANLACANSVLFESVRAGNSTPRVSEGLHRRAEPRIHGSGAVVRFDLSVGRRHLPLTITREGSFAPTRFGSDTPCRAIRVRESGSRFHALTGRAYEPSNKFGGSPSVTRLRGGPEAGPPPAPLREKKMRSAAPRVPSVTRPLFRGVPLSPGCTQPVEGEPAPFRSSRLYRTRTVFGGARTRPIMGSRFLLSVSVLPLVRVSVRRSQRLV